MAGLTEFVPQDTEKCPLSVLTVVRIKRVNFRNCPLYTGVGIKRLGCSVLQKLKFMSVFFLLKEISTNPARCSVGNKILLLYTFVTVKKKKKKILLSSLVLEGCLGTLVPRLSFKIPWVKMPMNSGSMNFSSLIFSLPAFSGNFFVFFCTDPCASRDLIEQITESSELDFLEIYPL